MAKSKARPNIPSLMFALILVGALGATLTSLSAHAEAGVTDNSIKIGLSAPMTGIQAAFGSEIKAVINSYFNQVNSAGGINGRMIKLVALDDAYLPDRAAANTTILLQDEKVFALTSYYGSAPTMASLPILANNKAPLIGGITGTDGLRAPFNRYMFNVRASYAEEAEAIVAQLLSIGLNNIGILYQNDGFGKSGMDGIVAALKKHNLQPSVVAPIEPNSVQVDSAIEAFKKAKPQEIIMIASFVPTSAFVRKLKPAGLFPYLSAFSAVGAVMLSNELGETSRGIMISQVMPYLWDDTLGIAKDYKKLPIKQDKTESLTYTGMEAYINARVLVEAIKLAGKNLTRDKLIDALESMHDYNVGGYQLSYSSANHNGSRFVESTGIGQNGKVMH